MHPLPIIGESTFLYAKIIHLARVLHILQMSRLVQKRAERAAYFTKTGFFDPGLRHNNVVVLAVKARHQAHEIFVYAPFHQISDDALTDLFGNAHAHFYALGFDEYQRHELPGDRRPVMINVSETGPFP